MSLFRRALTVFCAAILLVGIFSLTAYADEDANVTYTGNSGQLIFEPGSEYSPTDLFANFKNVMPGASLTQKITVRNKADDKVKVKIFLRSLGSTDEKFNEFLDQLTLTVRKGSDTPMFEAEADKTAGLTDWVCLGTLYSGGSLDLDVILDVPTTLDNTFQKLIGKIKWQFVVEELPIEELTWKCENGETHSYHIEEQNGISVFVCDDCDNSEPVKCKVCGGDMHEVIAVEIGGNTYTAYPDGYRHYVTKDGSVHFYMDGDGIIDHYTVNGKTINVKSVDEYVLYAYYECLNDEEHHTDPQPVPKTGDESRIELWIILMAVCVVLLIILLIWKRRSDRKEEVRAKCREEKQ